MAESKRDQEKEDAEKHQSTMDKLVHDKNGKKVTPVSVPKTPGPTSKVTGSKVLNITIHIGSLIKEFKLTSVTLKEGVAQMQRMVAEALMGAVNDSQLAAGD